MNQNDEKVVPTEKSEEILQEIKNLPDDQQEMIMQRVMVSYSGPLPPANEMERYEKLEPGALNRMLTMSEQNGEHIRRCEEKDVDAKIKFNLRGQTYSFAVTLGVLALAAVAFLTDNTVVGVIFGGVGVSPIITSFFANMKDDHKS